MKTCTGSVQLLKSSVHLQTQTNERMAVGVYEQTLNYVTKTSVASEVTSHCCCLHSYHVLLV